MLESNIKTVRNDMRTLVKDAQELFREATTSTGEKADELRSRGMVLLDAAMEKAQEVQAAAKETSKEVMHTTDEFVQHNPWMAIAVSTGIGMLVGMLLARK